MKVSFNGLKKDTVHENCVETKIEKLGVGVN